MRVPTHPTPDWLDGRESRAFAARLGKLGIPFQADLYRGGRDAWPLRERDLVRALPVLLGSAR